MEVEVECGPMAPFFPIMVNGKPSLEDVLS